MTVHQVSQGLEEVAPQAIISPSEDLSRLTVTLPDYEVETVNGVHEVTLPGETRLYQQGKPVVPALVVEQTYPVGTIIHDVRIHEQSDPITTMGWVLPIGNTNPDVAGEVMAPPVSDFTGWFPTRPLDWKVLVNGDGTRTLQVLVYPFQYNNVTTEARYTQELTLAVESTTSTLGIEAATVDKLAYKPGESMTLNLTLYSSEPAQDVVLNAEVKRYGTDEWLAGLLVDRLETVTGTASWSGIWNTTEQASGNCFVDICVSTPDGQILDRRTLLFKILEN
jgi:hypothetical protein